MKRLIFSFIAIIMAVSAWSQENEVRRFPEIHNNDAQKKYYEYNVGFWISAEVNSGYAFRTRHSNFGYTELDVTGGYRFNQYLKAGLGLGARYYFDNNKVRFKTGKWVMPIFLNVRGNFIPDDYRNVVPFYSVDLGGTAQDGFMFRPSVGLRIGQKRSAFIVALGYCGQDVTSFSYNEDGDKFRKRSFVSLMNLKLGYEF